MRQHHIDLHHETTTTGRYDRSAAVTTPRTRHVDHHQNHVQRPRYRDVTATWSAPRRCVGSHEAIERDLFTDLRPCARPGSCSERSILQSNSSDSLHSSVCHSSNLCDYNFRVCQHCVRGPCPLQRGRERPLHWCSSARHSSCQYLRCHSCWRPPSVG